MRNFGSVFSSGDGADRFGGRGDYYVGHFIFQVLKKEVRYEDLRGKAAEVDSEHCEIPFSEKVKKTSSVKPRRFFVGMAYRAVGNGAGKKVG